MTGQRSDEELDRSLREVVIGPLEKVDIRVVDYDPDWPRRFEAEAARLDAALASGERPPPQRNEHNRATPRPALRIEHIGSTAVPGLPAKPIVDILLVVEDSSDEASYLPALEDAGYVLRIREPDWHQHRMLRTPDKDVHVHVFSPDSPEIDRYLLFRDRLRADAAERRLYACAKRRLAARDWPTMQHYAEAKTEVVEAIIARATAARDAGARE